MKNEVAVPKHAQTRLRTYIGQLQQMQAQVNQYVQGVTDSLGLDGQWSLDVGRMVLVKVETPKPTDG